MQNMVSAKMSGHELSLVLSSVSVKEGMDAYCEANVKACKESEQIAKMLLPSY